MLKCFILFLDQVDVYEVKMLWFRSEMSLKGQVVKALWKPVVILADGKIFRSGT
jgi:hypothetical protein